MSPSSSTYSVRNVSGETVRTGQVESTTSESISLNGLPDGLYSLHLANSNYQDQTYFYYGDLALFTDRFAKACTSQQPLGFPCEALRRLSSLLSDPKGRFDLPTQNAILFLIEQFQWSLSPPPLSSSDGNRILLKQYRSSLDGTNQYYYLFVPPGHENERKLRLVVVIPPASQAKPFFENDSTINPFPLQQYAAYAARYNLALIQPYARGGMVPLGKSEADVLDAISDVRHIITVDNAHIFAAGDCSGGRSAILMAEDHPDIFAAVATIDAATGFQLSSRGVLQDKVNALLRIGQLTGHPVGLIHEDPDPHSPFPQATAFLSEAAKVGVNPTIIRLPVDNTYTLKCTREEMFNYLSGLK